jgi:hypothetical protein
MEGRWKRRGINKSIRTYEIKQMRGKEDQMRGRTKVAGDFLSMPRMEKKIACFFLKPRLILDFNFNFGFGFGFGFLFLLCF